MSTPTAVVVITIAALALGALCFSLVVLTATLVKLTRLAVARNPIEAARAESILKSQSRPPLEHGYDPAELP